MTYTVNTRTVKCFHIKSFDFHTSSSQMLNMIFIPMTNTEDSEVEDFYFDKLDKYSGGMTKLPTTFEITDNIRYKAKRYDESEAKFSVEIKTFDKHREGKVRQTERLPIRYHIPEIRDSHEFDSDVDVCFNNDSYNPVKILFGVFSFFSDMMEEMENDKSGDSTVITKEHLFPLQMKLRAIEGMADEVSWQAQNAIKNSAQTLRKANTVLLTMYRLSIVCFVVLMIVTCGQMFFLRFYFQDRKSVV